VAVFGGAGTGIVFRDVPVVEIALPAMGVDPAVCEGWRACAPPRTGRSGTVCSRANKKLPLGCVAVHESAIPPVEGETQLQRAAFDTYSQVFMLLGDSAYTNLVRVWNYVPDVVMFACLEADFCRPELLVEIEAVGVP
jgi:hypothetical protein